MALDRALAQGLWNSRYRDELLNQARRNKYLNEDHDPDDLFQDMAINVWLKAVNTFDAGAVTFTGNEERGFNAYFHQTLQRYLANLSAHRDTGKQTHERKKRSLDAPVRGSDEEEGSSLLERISGEVADDPELRSDLQMLLHNLPEELSGPLQYILENVDRGSINKVLSDIRAKWGFTETRLFNALMEEPEFVEFITNI